MRAIAFATAPGAGFVRTEFRRAFHSIGDILNAFAAYRMRQTFGQPACLSTPDSRPQLSAHGTDSAGLPLRDDRARNPELLRRPARDLLCEAIPVVFIGRNKDGLWVARDEKAKFGGIFLFRNSALLFARRRTSPAGCALVFPAESFELDATNLGSPLVSFIGALKRRWRRGEKSATGQSPGRSGKRRFIWFLYRLYRKTAVLGGGFRAGSNRGGDT